MGLTLDDCVVWDPHRPNGGLTVEQLRDAKMILWKGHCSVHGRFSDRGRRRAARHHPGRPDPGAPRVPARGRAQGRPGRLDRVHHQDHRGGPGRLELGDRHRAQPGQAARGRPPGQADHVPRQDRLLLLDDEPDRPPPLRVGAGVAGRRHRSSTGSRSTPRPSSGPWSPSSGCSPCRARPTRTEPARSVCGLDRAQSPGAPQTASQRPRSCSIGSSPARRVADLDLEQVVAPPLAAGVGANA